MPEVFVSTRNLMYPVMQQAGFLDILNSRALRVLIRLNETGVSFDPTFDPTKEETYEFLDKFFGEMCDLFPDEYFHIGGDENNGKQWNANRAIQKFMLKNNIKDNHELQAYFNNRILKILTKHGKKMIGWDEILHENMPKNIK